MHISNGMLSAESLTLERLDRTLDWYWSHGRLRQGDQMLPRGSWLDQLYRTKQVVGRAVEARPTLGVWGPSQSGKSTLFASFLDNGPGCPSPCLTWEASSPVNFIGRQVKGAIVLNPHNRGADASGCVTRFTSQVDGVLPSHPVTIRLNRPTHILHSLACGYLSECKTATADGTETYWDREKLDKEFLHKASRLSRQSAREGYELLREVVDILEIFVKSRERRYGNLNPGWAQIRRDLLESSDLCQSQESVMHFAANLFWDGSPTLSSLLHRLSTRLNTLSWENREILCTMEVAALLLDIDTFRHFQGPDDDHGRRVQRQLGQIGFRDDGKRILIEIGTPSAHISGAAFGDFQALVRELVVPIKVPTVRREESFFKLIAQTDVLDFPGVALRDSEKNQLNAIDLSQIDVSDPKLLTTVIKRGKTASIVMGYGSDVSIDAFALLVRSQTFPARPEQLRLGIEHWWKCVRPDFDSASDLSGKPPLPLSLCLTFFGRFLNATGQIQDDKGLGPVFRDMLMPLAPLDKPENTIFFATTYKEFVDGGAILIKENELATAVDKVRSDKAFKEKFVSKVSRESLDHMVADEDGGVSYFFGAQSGLIQSSGRRACLQQLREECARGAVKLVESALPSGGDMSAKQREIVQSVIKGVEARLAEWSSTLPVGVAQFPEIEDATSVMSYWIRCLSSVDPTDLDSVPLGYAELNREAKDAYLDQCFVRWREGAVNLLKQTKGFNWSYLGLKGEQDALLLLRFLSDGRSRIHLQDWLSNELGYIEEEPRASTLREQVAVAMGNFVRTGNVEGQPRRPELIPIQQRMLQYVAWENEQTNPKESPHYSAVIEPFLAMLDKLPPPRTKRPPQEGDAELASIWNI